MISNNTTGPRGSGRGPEGEARAAGAVQALLDRVTADAEQGGRPEAVEALEHLIERVHEAYQRLADIEIQRAIAAALTPPHARPHTSEPPVIPFEGIDPLEELEALIRGGESESPPREAPAPMADLPAPAVADAQADDAPAEEQAPAPQAELSEPAVASINEELGEEGPTYEGTVRLLVDAAGNMQRVLRFVDELGRRPQFRVLRMTGDPQREGAEIDMGLREPVPFLWVLRSMGYRGEALSNEPNSGIPRIAVAIHQQHAG